MSAPPQRRARCGSIPDRLLQPFTHASFNPGPCTHPSPRPTTARRQPPPAARSRGAAQQSAAHDVHHEQDGGGPSRLARTISLESFRSHPSLHRPRFLRRDSAYAAASIDTASGVASDAPRSGSRKNKVVGWMRRLRGAMVSDTEDSILFSQESHPEESRRITQSDPKPLPVVPPTGHSPSHQLLDLAQLPDPTTQADRDIQQSFHEYTLPTNNTAATLAPGKPKILEQAHRDQKNAEEQKRKQFLAILRAREQARREARRDRTDGGSISSSFGSMGEPTSFARRHPADAEIYSRGWQLMQQQDRFRTPAQQV